MSQKIIVTTSPWKDYKTGKWMLSAVFNIQLDAVGNTTLAAFPDVLQWMDKLQQTIFFVQWGNTVPVEIKPKTERWNPELYTKLFHDKIKVEGFLTPDISKLIIKSYPVMHVANFVLDAYKEVGNLKIDELPKTDFYANDWKKLDSIASVQLTQNKPLTAQRRNATKNDFLRSSNAGISNVRQQLAQSRAIPFTPQANASMDFGQFQNFHGINGKALRTPPVLKQPEFEYHDITSVITSYPVIMRKLGLIVDFELPAAPSANGTVRILPTNLGFTNDVQVSSPATAYEIAAGHFYTAAKPGSFISKGMLKVNTPDFSVVQFDTDAAAMKLAAHATAVYTNFATQLVFQSNYLNFINLDANNNAATNEKNDAPEDDDKEEGLPTLRSAGIGLVKNGLADHINKKLSANINVYKSITNPVVALKNDVLFNKAATPLNTKDAAVRKANIAANNKPIRTAVANPVFIPVATEILYADDLVHGYRMDIAYEDKPNTWYSLHKRKNTYDFSPVIGAVEKVNLSADEELDEGCIHIALTKDGNDAESTAEKVNEVLARWEGWSLAVPKPGKGMNDGKDEFHINSDEEEKKKYKLNNEVPFRLQVNTGTAPKTLPMLRFGKTYKLKVRTVDIAGNGLPHDVLPDNAAELVKGGIKYLRYEPLPVPVLVQADEVTSGDKTKMRDRDGESIEHLVVRSNVGVSTNEYEKNNPTNLYKTTNPGDKAVITTLSYLSEAVRHVKAPRASQHMSELHGMFDESFSDINAAKETYNFITLKDNKETKDDGTRKAAIASPNDANLSLEYLADPMAAGVVLTMKTDTSFETSWKKGTSKKFSFYFDEEVTDASVNRSFSKIAWRSPKSFRIKLTEGTAAPFWDIGQRMLIIYLAKSARIEINYASFWRPEDVDRYSAMHPVLTTRGVSNGRAGDFARKSLHWMFSPWRTIRLVHAVQQPLEAPTTYKNETHINKEVSDTFATIFTRVNVHGSSTDKIDVEANWEEMVDDLGEVEPKNIKHSTHVDTIPIDYTDKTFYCNAAPGHKKFAARAPMIKHQYGDTKHRNIEYDLVATTRYREYFTGIIETAAKTGKAISLTQTGFIENPAAVNNADKKLLNILSSAKPAAPEIDYIIPSFNWIKTEKRGEMVHMRTGNIRVYLKRPWYSSGNGEKLAVLLPVPNVAITATKAMHCTMWGKDPVFNSPELNQSNYPQKENFPFAADYDMVGLAEDPNSKMVIAAYTVLFDKEKQLHYADIPIDIKQAYFPFVRLCLARYQRDSIRKDGIDYCLSNSVTADWLQVVPVRYTAVYFKGSNNVFDVAVRGTAPYTFSAATIKGLPENNTRCRINITIENTTVPKTEDAFISITNRVQGINTTQYIKEYELQKEQLKGNQVEFVERIELSSQFASQPFRVVIREYELHEADPVVVKAKQAANSFATQASFVPEYTERLVFMDVFEVNGSV